MASSRVVLVSFALVAGVVAPLRAQQPPPGYDQTVAAEAAANSQGRSAQDAAPDHSGTDQRGQPAAPGDDRRALPAAHECRAEGCRRMEGPDQPPRRPDRRRAAGAQGKARRRHGGDRDRRRQGVRRDAEIAAGGEPQPAARPCPWRRLRVRSGRVGAAGGDPAGRFRRLQGDLGGLPHAARCPLSGGDGTMPWRCGRKPSKWRTRATWRSSAPRPAGP